MKTFKRYCTILFSCLALMACQPTTDRQTVTMTGQTMGTTYTIKYVHHEHQALPSPAQVKAQIDAQLKQVNQEMSTYLPDSQISQFNQGKTLDKMPIADDFAIVLKEAIRLNRLTQGGLDITISPLVNLWGFGPEKNTPIPTQEQLEEIQNIVGMDKIDLELSLSTQQASLSKKIPEVSIDLSSIAKGFAVDKLATYLERLGIEHYLVEIGGELKAKGKNIYQQTWSIGIEQPLLAQQQHAQVIVPLDNQAMATSGDYRQFRLDAEGRRVSHLMDPRTFSPIHHHLASITVLHTNAMTADGLATGLFVLGDEKAMEIAEKEQLAIFLIIKTEEGFTTKMSSSFRKLLPKNF